MDCIKFKRRVPWDEWNSSVNPIKQESHFPPANIFVIIFGRVVEGRSNINLIFLKCTPFSLNHYLYLQVELTTVLLPSFSQYASTAWPTVMTCPFLDTPYSTLVFLGHNLLTPLISCSGSPACKYQESLFQTLFQNLCRSLQNPPTDDTSKLLDLRKHYTFI